VLAFLFYSPTDGILTPLCLSEAERGIVEAVLMGFRMTLSWLVSEFYSYWDL
jgi:hypothetical protein